MKRGDVSSPKRVPLCKRLVILRNFGYAWYHIILFQNIFIYIIYIIIIIINDNNNNSDPYAQNISKL